MVALFLVQPALGQEFIRAWKHGRIARCRKVAEGDQSLNGVRGRRVSARSQISAARRRTLSLDTLTFFGMR